MQKKVEISENRNGFNSTNSLNERGHFVKIVYNESLEYHIQMKNNENKVQSHICI